MLRMLEDEDIAPGVAGRKFLPTPPVFPPASAEVAPITGTTRRRMLRGKSPRQRAKVAAGFVAGSSQLVLPTPAQAARLTGASAISVRRALGRTPRSPSRAEMAEFIGRYGISETESLLGQIKTVAATRGAP